MLGIQDLRSFGLSLHLLLQLPEKTVHGPLPLDRRLLADPDVKELAKFLM